MMTCTMTCWTCSTLQRNMLMVVRKIPQSAIQVLPYGGIIEKWLLMIMLQ